MLTPPLFTRFGGVNTFDDNWGFLGGAIYNGVDATIAFPEDGGEVIFQNLRGEVGDIDGDFVFHFVVATFYLLQIGSFFFCVSCVIYLESMFVVVTCFTPSGSLSTWM